MGLEIVKNKKSRYNIHTHTNRSIKAVIFTRLSSLLATMEAKRLSPANSEMRKIYSGAVT